MTIIRVLVVSTADQCRGPAAEALLRDRLGRQASGVEIWSAGTVAVEGSAVHPLSVEALSHNGVHLRSSTARRLVPDDVLGADLVLCAERMHRLHVARMPIGDASKTFTVAEFARIGPHLHEAGFAEMLAEAVTLRAAYPADQPGDDDIADPLHGDYLEHGRMVRRLTDMAVRIAPVLSMATFHAAEQDGRRGSVDRVDEIVLPPGPHVPLEL